MKNQPKNQRGAVLILGLILLMILTIAGFSAMRTSSTQEKTAINHDTKADARAAAEEGASIVSQKILNEECVLSNLPCGMDAVSVGQVGSWLVSAHSSGPEVGGKKKFYVTIEGRMVKAGVIISVSQVLLTFEKTTSFDPLIKAEGGVNIPFRSSITLEGDIGSNGLVNTVGSASLLGENSIHVKPNASCTGCGSKRIDLATELTIKTSEQIALEKIPLNPITDCSSISNGTSATDIKYYRCAQDVTIERNAKFIVLQTINNKNISIDTSGRLEQIGVVLISSGGISIKSTSNQNTFTTDFYADGAIDIQVNDLIIEGIISSKGSISITRRGTSTYLLTIKKPILFDGNSAIDTKPKLIEWSAA